MIKHVYKLRRHEYSYLNKIKYDRIRLKKKAGVNMSMSVLLPNSLLFCSVEMYDRNRVRKKINRG